jgi:hypothetical protein
VAAVSGIGQDATDLVADGLLHVRDERCQRVTVIRVAGKRHGMQGEPAALAAFERRADRHLDAELVGRMRLALASTFDLVGVQAADLAATLALPLLQNRPGLVERPFEDRIRLRVAGDLALDVGDSAAEIGPELAQRLVGALELVWMPAVLQGEL